MLFTILTVCFGMVFAVNVAVLLWVLAETAWHDSERVARGLRNGATVLATQLRKPAYRRQLVLAMVTGFAGMGIVLQAVNLQRVAAMRLSEHARVVFELERQEGLQAVRRGDYWGYVDESGTQRIGQRFVSARSFSEGLAPVCDGHRWGYIDRNGDYVIEPQFRLAGEHRNGMAPVGLDDYSLGYVNTRGKIVGRPNSDSNPAADANV